jgi:hypothetical protein
MEKNAPSTLSTMKAACAREGDQLFSSGNAGGSTKSLVPERKSVECQAMREKSPEDS